MKAILLNVDGVLVHAESLGAAGSVPLGKDYYAQIVDAACVLRLASIVKATGAVIVVTSTWRKDAAQRNGLAKALRRGGLRYRDALELPQRLGAESRGAAIAAWLAEYPVDVAVALDDCPVPGVTNLDPLPSYFNGGLLDFHVDQAIQALGIK